MKSTTINHSGKIGHCEVPYIFVEVFAVLHALFWASAIEHLPFWRVHYFAVELPIQTVQCGIIILKYTKNIQLGTQTFVYKVIIVCIPATKVKLCVQYMYTYPVCLFTCALNVCVMHVWMPMWVLLWQCPFYYSETCPRQPPLAQFYKWP